MDRLVAAERQRTSHDTHHTVEPDWPLTLGVDGRGCSVHVCADCREEIPDGCLVERAPTGQVIAWTSGGNEADGTPIRNIVHECAGLHRG